MPAHIYVEEYMPASFLIISFWVGSKGDIKTIVLNLTGSLLERSFSNLRWSLKRIRPEQAREVDFWKFLLGKGRG